MVVVTEAPVVDTEHLSGNNFVVTVRAPEVASSCRCGQFVMASLEEPLQLPSPLLKRALAVYSVESESGQSALLRLLIKVIGDGTARLASARPGQKLSIVGPLGKGFRLQEADLQLIVAGGVGIASVLMLAQELSIRREPVHLFYGGRSSGDLVGLADFERLGLTLHLSTEDGSRGIEGRVTQPLETYLSHHRGIPAALYTCGPNPMMEAVSRLASDFNLPCQISVEANMACGFGVCLGCSVETIDGYRLACTHGPVFDAAQFIWHQERRIQEVG